MRDYILTIDTGGSKTQLTLFDSGGKKLSFSRCGGLGVTDEKDSMLDILEEALQVLLDKESFPRVGTVIINVGGTNTEQLKNEFARFFPAARIEAFRESSGVIMSALCDAENTDAILMAGTGSIALAKGECGSIITDGWCPNVGDFGSGYYIGLEAIRRSVQALEKASPLPPLAKHITGLSAPFCAFADTAEQMHLRDKVRSNFMPLERLAVAGLTHIAADCARSGDHMATGIFCDAGRELAHTVLRALRIAKSPDDAKILVSGGLTHCFDLWGKCFEKTLNEENKNYTYCIGEADMTKGALYYAQQYKHIQTA